MRLERASFDLSPRARDASCRVITQSLGTMSLTGRALAWHGGGGREATMGSNGSGGCPALPCLAPGCIDSNDHELQFACTSLARYRASLTAFDFDFEFDSIPQACAPAWPRLRAPCTMPSSSSTPDWTGSLEGMPADGGTGRPKYVWPEHSQTARRYLLYGSRRAPCPRRPRPWP